jgi:molybdate transport system substrate-binding protein
VLHGFPTLLVLISVASTILGGCSSPGHENKEDSNKNSQKNSFSTIQVYAAISLKEGVLEVGKEFTKQYGHTLSYNFASSNTLAQQILATPKTDVFLSAHPYWSQKVREKYPQKSTLPRAFLSNQLVLIKSTTKETYTLDYNTVTLCSLFQNFPKDKTLLAIGNPKAVPAGTYAQSWLQSISCTKEVHPSATLWSLVEHRILPTSNVRNVLHYVEHQKNIWGIVYESDLHNTTNQDRIQQIYTISDRELKAINSPIQYVSMTIHSSQKEANTHQASEEFIHFLSSPAAQTIWKKNGFHVLSPLD